MVCLFLSYPSLVKIEGIMKNEKKKRANFAVYIVVLEFCTFFYAFALFRFGLSVVLFLLLVITVFENGTSCSVNFWVNGAHGSGKRKISFDTKNSIFRETKVLTGAYGNEIRLGEKIDHNKLTI